MTNQLKNKRIEDLPDILTPQQVADYLGISRKKVYELCQVNPDLGGLISFSIGKSRKIEKSTLLIWLESLKKGELP
ncbi:helix-turn-helix domain-containing protein [Paenibacillus dendritiformis]|uniref:helix-turn-helix domain-containing protein n=1 Tax=Paenibacillus dendritiformis TaxID=130049 RepID=UPI0036539CCE